MLPSFLSVRINFSNGSLPVRGSSLAATWPLENSPTPPRSTDKKILFFEFSYVSTSANKLLRITRFLTNASDKFGSWIESELFDNVFPEIFYNKFLNLHLLLLMADHFALNYYYPRKTLSLHISYFSIIFSRDKTAYRLRIVSISSNRGSLVSHTLSLH